MAHFSLSDLSNYLNTMESVVARLEAVALKLESFEGTLITQSSLAPTNGTTATTTKQTPSSSATAPPSTAFSSTVISLLPAITTTLTNMSSADQSVQSAVSLFSQAFYEQLDIIKTIESKPPQDDALSQQQQLLTPLGSTLASLSSLTSSSSGSKSSKFNTANHLKFIAEASQCLTWIAYQGPGCGLSLPPQHIDEAWSAAEFWCHKVLLEFKSVDSGVKPWTAAVKDVVMALKTFTMQHYPTGPVWGTGIGSGSSGNGSRTSSSKGGRAAPPPPPPPPPPPGSLTAPKPKTTSTNSSSGPNVGALLAEINAKGSGITTGLKKVTNDMKTKNMPRMDDNSIPSKSLTGSSSNSAAITNTSAIGRLECEQGRKWVVENYTNAKDLQITQTEPKQAVYIYNCTNCTIQVSGKVNSIAIDKCTNTALVFETTVASCEVVNSGKVQIQWTGVCPTVAVDKTDGCQLFIPKQSVEQCEVNTAKSSEVNVVVLPDKEAEEDAQESAIPEQFVSKYVGGKWVTEPVNHGSG